MVACSVRNCKNRSENVKEKKIKFYSFPKKPEFAAKWMNACGKKVNLKTARICSIHFLPSCYKKKPEHYGDYSPTTVRSLLPDAVPTENLLNDQQILREINNDPSIHVNINKNSRLMPVAEYSSSIKVGGVDSTIHKENNDTSTNNYKLITLSKNVENAVPLRITEDASIQTINEKLSANIIENDNSFDQQTSVFDQTSCASCTSQNVYEVGIQFSLTILNKATGDSCTKNVNNENAAPSLQQATTSENKIGSENVILQLKKALASEREQNKFIQKTNKLLKKHIKRLQREKTVTVEKKVYEILRNVFTPQQIYKIINPQKKIVKWGIEDIASAIALRSVSPKAYRYLKKNNYPLPGLSTLRNWASRLDLAEGVLIEILALMKRKADSLLDFEKIVVVCFDEIYISHKVEIDRKTEQAVGPHKTCQIGIARGLFSKWKQPIYYSYDQALNSSIINEVITKLYDAGYTVVAVTTDLGPSNSKTWKDMNVGIDKEQKCNFTHPSNDNLKVFVFADGPHLLKLIRNHYFDRGFLINDKHISKTCIERMLSINCKDLKVMFKVTEADLNVAGQARQKVSTAAKLFSQTTARSIGWCGEQGFLYKEEAWKETAELVQLVNDWFDLFNSKSTYERDPKKKPYGLNLDYQNNLLNAMTNFMYEMRVGGHKNLLPFQKGVILNNTSLQEFLPYLQQKYRRNDFNLTYILTNRLTQDCLENLFSFLRAMGAANDQPSALNLRYRLRWYLLGKHAFDMLSNAVNTEVDGDESNLINFNDTEDSLIAAAFDVGQKEYPNPAVDEELINTFQNEEFINNDVNEFQSDMGMYEQMN